MVIKEEAKQGLRNCASPLFLCSSIMPVPQITSCLHRPSCKDLLIIVFQYWGKVKIGRTSTSTSLSVV